MASELRGSACFCSPSLGVTGKDCQGQLFIGGRGSDSRPSLIRRVFYPRSHLHSLFLLTIVFSDSISHCSMAGPGLTIWLKSDSNFWQSPCLRLPNRGVTTRQPHAQPFLYTLDDVPVCASFSRMSGHLKDPLLHLMRGIRVCVLEQHGRSRWLRGQVPNTSFTLLMCRRHWPPPLWAVLESALAHT